MDCLSGARAARILLPAGPVSLTLTAPNLYWPTMPV